MPHQTRTQPTFYQVGVSFLLCSPVFALSVAADGAMVAVAMEGQREEDAAAAAAADGQPATHSLRDKHDISTSLLQMGRYLSGTYVWP